MSESLYPVKRTSLSDAIVKQITSQIASGLLKPGDQIPSEKELCLRFQVSRAPLREALRSLSVLGILESHAGEGTFVSASSARYLDRALQWGLLLERKTVGELVEARLALETHITFLAATRATEQDVREIEAAVRGMEEALSDPPRYLEHDLRFHLLLAEATKNSILRSLVHTIRGHLEASISQALTASGGRSPNRRAVLSLAQHKNILRAIKRRRPVEARQAMVEHIVSTSAGLRAYLSRSSAGQTKETILVWPAGQPVSGKPGATKTKSTSKRR